MAELSVDEFVTELIMNLEERIEFSFTPQEEDDLRRLLSTAVLRGETLDA